MLGFTCRIVCLKGLDGVHAVMRAQKPREGVFSHQAVDLLLGFVKSVGTRRVRPTQQSVTGLSIQVHLQRGKQTVKAGPPSIYWRLVQFPPTNLQRGVRVDKLAVDAAGLGPLQGWRGHPVVLTGQPKLKVLLTELGTQETSERLKANWEQKHSSDGNELSPFCLGHGD